MRTLYLLLIALTGCFDYEVQPPDSVVGESLGCLSQDGDLLCLTRYKGYGVDAQTLSSVPVADRVYPCAIDDASHVYDGDTISRVRILILKPTLIIVSELGEVFPNVVVTDGGIYIQNGVRIAGIDTPELRPSKKHADGTPRSEKSRANEKGAAIVARDAVRDLLSANDFRFTIADVDMDKYGRVLATVFVGDVNVGEYLIENNLAVRYDGGTKTIIDWDNL